MVLPPLPPGWDSATKVEFHTTEGRNNVAPLVRIVVTAGSVLTVDVTDVPDGRWWPVLVGVDGGVVVRRDLAHVDLPEDPTLAVSPERLAVKVGIPLQLTSEQREIAVDAIRDAQADVTAYLGRQILPTVGVDTERWPWPRGWNLTGLGDEPLIRVLGSVPETDENGDLSGYFTVTYLYGLDVVNDPTLRPILRFITAHAMNSTAFTDLWKRVTRTKGEIRSLSAEGQSVSWTPATLGGGGGKAGDGSPGSLPTLASLDRWRIAGRRVHQGATRTTDWPFTGNRW
jgi:hypothetical protein